MPQIPNIGYFRRSGGDTSEQGADSTTPRARIISDDQGRVMVLMTHNTDISDSWEREGDDAELLLRVQPARLRVRHQRAALRADALTPSNAWHDPHNIFALARAH